MSEPTYAAIARLLFTYADRLDAGDLAGMSALFEHATFRSVGADGIAAWLGGQPHVAAGARRARPHEKTRADDDDG